MAFKTSCHSVIYVLGDMDGVLIDVWTSLHCLEQDLGHQAGFNKSCLRRLGRNNSNGHMHFLIKIVQEKELSDCSRRS